MIHTMYIVHNMYNLYKICNQSVTFISIVNATFTLHDIKLYSGARLQYVNYRPMSCNNVQMCQTLLCFLLPRVDNHW